MQQLIRYQLLHRLDGEAVLHQVLQDRWSDYLHDIHNRDLAGTRKQRQDQLCLIHFGSDEVGDKLRILNLELIGWLRMSKRVCELY